MRKKWIPTIKVVYQPVKTVVPIYSPAAIAEQRSEAARRKEKYNRDQSVIAERREKRALETASQALVEAMADQSTRH